MLEFSFVCLIDNDKEFSQVYIMAYEFNQECILVRNIQGVYLHYMNGSIEHIGDELKQFGHYKAITKG